MEKTATILIADDNEKVRQALSEILLLQKYKVILAEDGKQAMEMVESSAPDVILLDIDMPEKSGLEVLEVLKAGINSKIIPVIIVTGESDEALRIKALKLGADDFLKKPPNYAELTARVGSLVKVKAYNDYMRSYQKKLEDEVTKRTKKLKEANHSLKNASLETIHRLARAAEYKDEDTWVHIHRMSDYAAEIARTVGMADEDIDCLLYAAPMHDVGKIGIPDKILLKPGKLTEGEWKIMQRHTQIGQDILEESGSKFLQMGETIALTHHEKWDGSGYPHGLKGDGIPLVGRIAALADVFDKLTSKRPYQVPFPVEKAFQIVKRGRKNHFDPALVDVFFDRKEKILEIKDIYETEGNSMLVEASGKTV